MKSGSTFTDAMIAGYTAVLCSPEFVCLEEKPGALDDHALAARLSFFLWNSEPDDELRSLAASGQLHRPEVFRAETERLLDDPKSRRFVDAFLDYWLDLRKIVATAPDAALYPDYYLDDLLSESAIEETQLFFAELLRRDLPARNLVASDFAMLNERLAAHYGLPGVEGVALRRVPLPPDSLRGGLLTQASVLKVTANGTTTSPVLRGAWIMERILGEPPATAAAQRAGRRARHPRRHDDPRAAREASHAADLRRLPRQDRPGRASRWRASTSWAAGATATAPLRRRRREPGIGNNGQTFTFHSGPPWTSER